MRAGDCRELDLASIARCEDMRSSAAGAESDAANTIAVREGVADGDFGPDEGDGGSSFPTGAMTGAWVSRSSFSMPAVADVP